MVLQLSLLLHLVVCEAVTLQYLGQVEAPQAGFSTIFQHSQYDDPAERYSIAQSTFSVAPGSTDNVLWMEFPGKYLHDVNNTDVREIYEEVICPRETGQVPHEVFGNEALSVPTGFLIPGKENGAIILMDLADRDRPRFIDISTATSDDGPWFYHRVLWRDGDGDGDLDAFTCRARVRLGRDTSQFVWFANPGVDAPVTEAEMWNVTVLSEADCDLFLTQTEMEVEGQLYEVTFTPGYFSDRLSVYWSEAGEWTDPNIVGSALVDLSSSEDRPDDHWFDVQVVDVNNDGRLDLLATINSPDNGTLVAYEIPDDFRDPAGYVKHVLASGFRPRTGMEASGSPGQARAFYPQTDMDSKPWVVMSGDDEGTCYYFTPQSQDPGDWEYQQVVILDLGERNIVGNPSVADLDGDGMVEMVVPTWDEGAVRFYSFSDP